MHIKCIKATSIQLRLHLAVKRVNSNVTFGAWVSEDLVTSPPRR